MLNISRVLILITAASLFACSQSETTETPAPAAEKIESPAPAAVEATGTAEVAVAPTEQAAEVAPEVVTESTAPAKVAAPSKQADSPVQAEKAPEAPAEKTAAPVKVEETAKIADTSTAPLISMSPAVMPANTKTCKMCHAIDKKKVGPAWNAVAEKYKADPNAAKTIADNIMSGGKFGWNFGMMPKRGNSKLSDAEIVELGKFIANLK
ncbi:MAG: c-type cytochrome [Gallionellaceae bacterium]